MLNKKNQIIKDKAMILLSLAIHALQCDNYKRASEKLNYSYKEIKKLIINK